MKFVRHKVKLLGWWRSGIGKISICCESLVQVKNDSDVTIASYTYMEETLWAGETGVYKKDDSKWTINRLEVSDLLLDVIFVNAEVVLSNGGHGLTIATNHVRMYRNERSLSS